MGLETPRMPSPEEAAKIEAGRERTEAEAKKEADLRNDGLSRQRNPSEKSKETARSVLYGNARAENQARDYEKIMGMELQHDYPGSIEKMEKVTNQGGRFSMDVYLFAHKSAETDEEKTRVYDLYQRQKVNPHEGGSRGKTMEMVMLQRKVIERAGK